MLSFQEFKEQILTVFNVTEKECKFARNCTYFGATISYDNYRAIVFDVKYIKSDGRWHIQKTYTQDCKTFSDSLTQGIKTIDQQTTENINCELQVFFKIQKGWRNTKFKEYFESLDGLTETKSK